jgi:L-amino acid N-acyltransferase YncA
MICAVLVAASAWMISRKPWISRNHADRMYYAISMAGVVLFFAYNAPKRADLGYRDTIANIRVEPQVTRTAAG